MPAAHSSALAISLWLNVVMVMSTVSLFAVPVLAPAIGADLATPTALVGVFAGTIWATSLVTAIAAGTLIARFGAWRVTQLGLLLCASGLFAGATGNLAGLALAAVLIGLGNGAETPTSSQLLARSVPPQRRAAYFSLKQTGVQIGGVATAVVFPLLAAYMNWRAALAIGGAAVLVFMLLVERPRRRYAQLGTPGPVSTIQFRAAFAAIKRHRVLRRLAIAAAAFGAAQVCLNSFMVSYAVAERGVTLAQAGVLLAVAQSGGLIGRLAWGWIASHYVSALSILRGLGAAMAASSLIVGVAGAVAPEWFMLPLCFVFGLTASGWNGVFLAEISHEVPLEQVGATTGAIIVIMTLGLVFGPLVFAAIQAVWSYGGAFIVLAAIAAAGTIALPRRMSAVDSTRTSGGLP